MNKAIDDCSYFANGFYPEHELSMKERYEIAHQSISDFQEYYRSNRRYVDSETSLVLDNLRELLSKEIWVIHDVIIAENWMKVSEYSSTLRDKSLKLREKILDSFRE